MKKMRTIAIIVIAAVMLLSLIATGLLLTYTPDIQAHSTTDVDTTVVTTSGANGNSILLVDRSGSTRGMTVTGSDYATVVNFSSGLGVVGGYSEIAEAMEEVLRTGYSRVGIVTDCEETHKNGDTSWSALTGSYSNVEITIYLTEEYEDNDVQDCIVAVSAIIDPQNSSFKILKADGTLYYVGCDGFDNEDKPVATTHYHTESEEGNKVPLSFVIILVETFFLIFCIMAILLLALCGCKGTGNAPIETAISSSDGVLLDGSGSVKDSYSKAIKYCRKLRQSFVIRFSGSVAEMTVDEAEHVLADGGTRGYEALKVAYEKGYRTITVVTDGQFNDEESLAAGVVFDKIFFVGASLKAQNVEHLKKFGKQVSVIAI
jgi:hypothetical protein